MTRKKKLIEVALPLEAINAAAAREKSLRHGHPSTLHLWWARRPLAACRAVLFAQLVDDPSSHPDRFPTEESVQKERENLFKTIENLVKWESSTDEKVLESARSKIRESCGPELPSVCDPFSGGGSIPLEAQRLGLPAYGSDLNPVAVTIGKAMVEIPPKFKNRKPVYPDIRQRQFLGDDDPLPYYNAKGLAEDIKHYGNWMREKAFDHIGNFYPQVNLPGKNQKATVVAWIWARTVPSPDPAFSDVQVPLAATFLLNSKKARKEIWIEPIVDKVAKTIAYRIRTGGTIEEIKSAKLGTSAGKRQAFRCLMSGAAIPYDHIRRAGKSGQMNQELMAIVAEQKGGKIYLEPDESHVQIARSARCKSKPETTLPENHRDFKGPGYGMNNFGDLFTERQLMALNTFSNLVQDARTQIEQDALAAGMEDDPTPLHDGGAGAKAYAEAVSVYLAFALDKCSDYWSSICSWHNAGETMGHTFGRQAIQMTWDFAEANPFSTSTGNWMSMVNWIYRVVSVLVPGSHGSIKQHDAQTATYPAGAVLSTDPPYYDNICYAALSDFFFCWLKPALKSVYPDMFRMLATPKSDELVADPNRHGGKEKAADFFLEGMKQTITNMGRQLSDDYPITIYYAFKQSEIAQDGISSTGWETFLQAVIKAGYTVLGTWPLRTELSTRLIAMGSNALANSVVLVCRKRDSNAKIATRAEFIRALKHELPQAISELQDANIAPADMPQSAIGPGMGIFSSFERVLEAGDNSMPVKTALQLINAELDEFLQGLQGEFDGETRFAVTWFEQHGTETADYGAADNLARARGISVASMKQADIVDSSAGKVRILGRNELAAVGHPLDSESPVWKCCQCIIRALNEEGETVAATLLREIGSSKADQVKDLAYYLYDVCSNKRRDAKEATAYNGLIAAWPELTVLATDKDAVGGRQSALGF